MQSTTEPVGALVTRRPAAKRVLARHGIDFCCGGKKRLSEACAEAGLDPVEILAQVAEAEADSEEPPARWDIRPLPELIAHIETRFHAPLWQELGGLVTLARVVEVAHQDEPRCPHGLADHLSGVREAVERHLWKEERVLFPMILAGRGGAARMPIRVMVEEHEDHGKNLARTRELTGDLAAPEGACESWRALYDALRRLEEDLHEHVHLENNVLFPRALLG